MIGDDSKRRKILEEARVNLAVAQLIYDAREKAGLTQSELAELIGTKQPVIARLEDADYDGHSLSMLQLIAAALNHRVEIRLKPLAQKRLRRPNACRISAATIVIRTDIGGSN
jgi:ribosome-binding protein aMBF1 (putative translation factor)